MTSKEKLFKTMDKIEQIKNIPIALTENEQLELRNLEVKKMQYWSEWKD